MLQYYGPYAAALSYIVGQNHNKGKLQIYRGMSLPNEILETYEIGNTMTLNGFKSGSLDKEQAFKFAF